MVLVSSRAQQTSSAKQTTSMIKINVNQSSEASCFQMIRGGFFIGKHLTQETLPCQIPPPLGEIVTFALPILESRYLARSPTPCPSVGSRWHAHYSYIINMHVWVIQKTITSCITWSQLCHSKTARFRKNLKSSKDNYSATYLLKHKSKSFAKRTNSQQSYAKILTTNTDT